MGRLLSDREMPGLSWSHDTLTGDITVTSTSQPGLVEVWSAPSCSDKRRDWRTVSLDTPCTCGTSNDGVCFNEVSVWTSQQLEETSPGR